MKTFFTKYKFIFSVILLTIIFVAPCKVHALSYKSDYIALEESVELETDKFVMDLEYTLFSNGTPEEPAAITGHSLKKVKDPYYYHYIIYYYNSNQEEIGATDGYNHITNSITNYSTIEQVGNYISSMLDAKKMYANHSLSEIKYYKVFIESATKEITDQYLYQNHKKLNENGLDDITDFHTVSMIVKNLKDESVTSNGNQTDNDHKILKPSQNSKYRSYNYVIDQYDIHMVVHENNTFDITETITAYFHVPKHGIFRTIPLKNTVTRLNGTTSTNRTQITNLSVDHEYSTSREDGNYKIQIGSENLTLTGEQTYVIQYTYNIGKDPVRDYDELYYNIIGTGWDTVIGNVTFDITMPKEFDSSKLGFSSGIYGSTDNSHVTYTVQGNTISGSYNGVLEPGEAFTVRSELPEGYFVGAGLTINILDYILFFIPVLFFGISIFLWYKFGRDAKIVETVEFYPPADFNSLEVGFLYKGKAGSQDVTSLLIYLANKGYIKISETEEKSLFSKIQGFKVTKLKEYDGNNINEKIFLNGLFAARSSFSSLDDEDSETPTGDIHEVTSLDLYDRFYLTTEDILYNINNQANENKIFEKSASGKKVFIILMIIASYCLITIPPIIAYGEPGVLLFALLFPGIGFTIMFSSFFGENQTVTINGRATRSPIIVKLFGFVFGALFGGFPWAFIVLPALLLDPVYLIGYIIGLVCILGMIICFKYLPKRTPYGNEILGKLRGFRNFLETAEKDRLEALVLEDPSYFYDILPYTYVLGVSDKWIHKFETISLQAPSWYDSSTTFNAAAFGTFMNHTMASAERAMSSSPSDSSGGSSSGGGSSGGGSGGGGGGSW